MKIVEYVVQKHASTFGVAMVTKGGWVEVSNL